MEHNNGMFYVKNNEIYNSYNNVSISKEDISVLIDIDTNTLIKIGDSNFITNYRDTMVQAYIKAGFPIYAESFINITFNTKCSELNIDEICTIINWLYNSIRKTEMNRFLHLPISEMKKEIQRLQKFGF